MALVLLQIPGRDWESESRAFFPNARRNLGSNEPFNSALSPTPPFPRNTYRLRLAGLIVPALCISLFVTSYMFMKGVTFGVGFALFGDPVISRGLDWLNRKIPNWQKLLEIRK